MLKPFSEIEASLNNHILPRSRKCVKSSFPFHGQRDLYGSSSSVINISAAKYTFIEMTPRMLLGVGLNQMVWVHGLNQTV